MQRRAEQRRVGQWSGCVTTPPEVPTQYRETDVPQSVSTGTLHWGPLPATRPHCNLCPHVFHLLHLLVQIHHRLVLDVSCLQGGRERGREGGRQEGDRRETGGREGGREEGRQEDRHLFTPWRGMVL